MSVRHLVLESLETPDGDRCVDIFRRAGDTYGFEEYRRDLEDSSGWFPIAHHRDTVYQNEADARTAATAKVSWLQA